MDLWWQQLRKGYMDFYWTYRWLFYELFPRGRAGWKRTMAEHRILVQQQDGPIGHAQPIISTSLHLSRCICQSSKFYLFIASKMWYHATLEHSYMSWTTESGWFGLSCFSVRSRASWNIWKQCNVHPRCVCITINWRQTYWSISHTLAWVARQKRPKY